MTDVADHVALLAAATGFVAALPVAATAHETPATGTIRPMLRWWRTATPKAVSIACASMTAGIAFAVCQVIGFRIVTPGFWLFSVLGVGLSYVDIRRRRLPNVATGAVWSVCAALFFIESAHGGRATHLMQAIGCGLLILVGMLIVALAAPGQLGLGDVHFAAAITFTLSWIRWEIGVAAIIVAWLVQAAWTLPAAMYFRRTATPFPFGPTLFGVWVVAVLASPLLR